MSVGRILDDILDSRAKVALLRALRRSVPGYSARAACRQAGVAKSTGQRALQGLVAAGLVEVSHGGGGESRYRLNREHYMVEPWLLQLLDAEAGMLPALQADLKALLADSGATVLVFGSVSRGEDVPGSDLDLLVIGPEDQASVAVDVMHREAARLQRRYGCRVSPLVMTLAELDAAVGFRQEVERDAIPVCGPSLAERRRHATNGA